MRSATSALLGLVAIAAVVAATHTPLGRCDSAGQPSLGIVQLTTGVPDGSRLHGPNPDGVFYVDDRNYVAGNGLWLYEESNGIYARENDPQHNLQRGSACGAGARDCPVPDPHGEICVDDPFVLYDTLLF